MCYRPDKAPIIHVNVAMLKCSSSIRTGITVRFRRTVFFPLPERRLLAFIGRNFLRFGFVFGRDLPTLSQPKAIMRIVSRAVSENGAHVGTPTENVWKCAAWIMGTTAECLVNSFLTFHLLSRQIQSPCRQFFCLHNFVDRIDSGRVSTKPLLIHHKKYASW